jgi:hypothetical protein
MLKKYWFILGGLVLPEAAKAVVDFGTGYGSAIGLGTQDIRTTVARIINVTLGILGMLMVLIIIYGVVGAAGGYGTDRFDTSKRIIGAGVIGLLIIIVAYALSTWVFNVIIAAT